MLLERWCSINFYDHQCLVAVFSLPVGFRSSASHIAALPFVEGESRSACFNAADVQNENAAVDLI